MLNMLIEPFRFDFINYALIIALLVSVPCALLSVFLVLKRLGSDGDAMSHAVFPGLYWPGL
ncbi:manganese ABC transporter, inner membrane permease protein SitD [Klebsiella pneumoniae]|uniref:Manganese ABC transporter, inner membrane permease protein SitD n=1 Tax=Klebsiella pneumoniae TaxID=573 RepID=A0A377WNA9_KLEPN|nr:manganese ABC transporter, inner membrane permease protein SitD [Klebsiella pneumoniae]